MKKFEIILPKQIPTAMVNNIAGIDEFKGRWDALKNFAPDSMSRIQRIATIASIGTFTRIEGVRLSDTQVDELLSNIDRKFSKEELDFWVKRKNSLRSSQRSKVK